MMNNGFIYLSEFEQIEWLNSFLDSRGSNFSTSAYVFEKYYQQCVSDMFGLEYRNDMLKKDVEAKKYYQLNYIFFDDMDKFKTNVGYIDVLQMLKNDKSGFLDRARKYGFSMDDNFVKVLQKLSDEELKKITKEKVALLMMNPEKYLDMDNITCNDITGDVEDDVVDENLVSLLKLYRFNNLEVKYAHTARVVYLANMEIEKLGIQDETVKNIIYISALFHDMGRFYQGAFYNEYAEEDLVKTEDYEEIKDHATAGYLYSLLDMINLNILGVFSDEDLVMHAIAAVVVSKHQIHNGGKEFLYYDRAYDDATFSENVDKKLLDFILQCYTHANKISLDIRPKFKKMYARSEEMKVFFVNETLNKIVQMVDCTNEDFLEMRKLVDSIYDFDRNDERIDDEQYLTEEEIEILREKLDGDELREFEEKNQFFGSSFIIT